VVHSGQFRYPLHNNGWRCSTLGRITPDKQAEQQFWSFFDFSCDFRQILDKEVTYIFELCTSQNRIVTKYPVDKLFLIGGRQLISGTLLLPHQIDQIVHQFGQKNCKISRPIVKSLKELGISSLKECLSWIEVESFNSEIYGEIPEGFVLLNEGIPVAKMKNDKYFEKHRLLTGSILFLRNKCLELFFEEKLDDLIYLFPNPIKQYAEELKIRSKLLALKVHELVTKIKSDVNEKLLESKDPKNWEKFYAVVVKANNIIEIDVYEKRFNLNVVGFLFTEKNLLRKEDADIPQIFLKDWLKSHYNIFDDFWKTTQVPEIIQELKIQEKVSLPGNK